MIAPPSGIVPGDFVDVEKRELIELTLDKTLYVIFLQELPVRSEPHKGYFVLFGESRDP